MVADMNRLKRLQDKARHNAFGCRFVAAASMENTGAPLISCSLISNEPLYFVKMEVINEPDFTPPPAA